MSAKSLFRSVLLAALVAAQFTQLGCVPVGVTPTIVDPPLSPSIIELLAEIVAAGGM